jgi:hypothetical protein
VSDVFSNSYSYICNIVRLMVIDVLLIFILSYDCNHMEYSIKIKGL